MKHLALFALLLPLSLPATPLSVNGCIGLSTPSCPGTIDTFTGNPGTLLASSSSPIYAPLGQNGALVQVASMLSAALRELPNADGHFSPLTFYYQLQMFSNFPGAVTSLDVIPTIYGPYPTTPYDVGVRQDAIAVVGFTTSTSSFDSVSMSNIGAFSVDNHSFPITPGQSSATLVVHTPYDYYQTGAFGAVFTAPDSSGNRQVYTARDEFRLLVPANVPEPSTWSLILLPLLGCWLWRKRQMSQ